MKKSISEKEFGISWLDRLVYENDDVIVVNSDKVKKVFYDSDNILKIEYADGIIGKVEDADIETIQNAAKTWASANPEKIKTILIEYYLGKPVRPK